MCDLPDVQEICSTHFQAFQSKIRKKKQIMLRPSWAEEGSLQKVYIQVMNSRRVWCTNSELGSTWGQSIKVNKNNKANNRNLLDAVITSYKTWQQSPDSRFTTDRTMLQHNITCVRYWMTHNWEIPHFIEWYQSQQIYK